MVSGVSGNHHPGHAVLDNVNSKILTFNSMPNVRYDDCFVAYPANTSLERQAREAHYQQAHTHRHTHTHTHTHTHSR